jgi:hypothetical protein
MALTGRVVPLSGFFRVGHDKAAWRALARQHGLSPLGEPWFEMDPETEQEITVGYIAQAPGLEVMASIISEGTTHIICYP